MSRRGGSTARCSSNFKPIRMSSGSVILASSAWKSSRSFAPPGRTGLRSGAKKLERVRAVFRFALEREWIPQNPASKLKPPIGSSKPANKHPFSDEEINRLFEACAKYKTRRWSNSFAEGEVTGDQIQTFMMLLIYTGLRISDAATFGPDKLQGNNAFLFMHKTDEPVFTWIPDELVDRLKKTPLERGKYYFRHSGNLVGSGHKVETAAVKIDCGNEVLRIAESAGCVLHPLNL